MSNQNWETPDWLVTAIEAKYHIDVDICATKESAKAVRYVTPKEDAFKYNFASWSGLNHWMNPPYGEMGKWLELAIRIRNECKSPVLCLVPVCPDTNWWWDYVLHSYKIIFLKGRIKFVGAKSSPRFSSALVLYRKDCLLDVGKPICTWWDWKNERIPL